MIVSQCVSNQDDGEEGNSKLGPDECFTWPDQGHPAVARSVLLWRCLQVAIARQQWRSTALLKARI